MVNGNVDVGLTGMLTGAPLETESKTYRARPSESGAAGRKTHNGCAMQRSRRSAAQCGIVGVVRRGEA